MKGILKTHEPTEFTNWKARANEDWKPTYGNLQNPEKAMVRKSLVKEQGFVCAYCCDSIEDDNVFTTVIEHFVPQHGPFGDEEKALDYENLFACCDGGKRSLEGLVEYCCDEIKRDQFCDPDAPEITLLKPTDKDEKDTFVCEIALAYGFDGSILSRESQYKKQAEFTVNTLNLNINELKLRREAAISFLFQDQNIGDFFELTADEIQKLKMHYRTLPDPENQPHLKKYCNIVSYFLSNYYP